jgi:hypothetical protein
MSGQRLDGLEAVTGHDGNRALVGSDGAVGNKLRQRGDGDTTCSLREDSFRSGQQTDSLDDLVISHSAARAATAPDHIERIPPVCGIPDCQRLCDGVGLDRDDGVSGVGERRGHR